MTKFLLWNWKFCWHYLYSKLPLEVKLYKKKTCLHLLFYFFWDLFKLFPFLSHSILRDWQFKIQSYLALQKSCLVKINMNFNMRWIRSQYQNLPIEISSLYSVNKTLRSTLTKSDQSQQSPLRKNCRIRVSVVQRETDDRSKFASNILKTKDLMLNVNRGMEAGSGVSDST